MTSNGQADKCEPCGMPNVGIALLNGTISPNIPHEDYQ
jgi:hypothetical protein